jgi:hypothetical protein
MLEKKYFLSKDFISKRASPLICVGHPIVQVSAVLILNYPSSCSTSTYNKVTELQTLIGRQISHNVIRFVSISAKFCICTVVCLNGTLVEAKIRNVVGLNGTLVTAKIRTVVGLKGTLVEAKIRNVMGLNGTSC